MASHETVRHLATTVVNQSEDPTVELLAQAVIQLSKLCESTDAIAKEGMRIAKLARVASKKERST
jgi:hypothetical protein